MQSATHTLWQPFGEIAFTAKGLYYRPMFEEIRVPLVKAAEAVVRFHVKANEQAI